MEPSIWSITAPACSALDPSDGAELLEKFPTLAANPVMLSKLWTLSLADASATNRVTALSVKETQRG